MHCIYIICVCMCTHRIARSYYVSFIRLIVVHVRLGSPWDESIRRLPGFVELVHRAVRRRWKQEPRKVWPVGFARLQFLWVVMLVAANIGSPVCFLAVDGRNPWHTTLKPWSKPLFVGIYKGIIIPWFPRRCRISSKADNGFADWNPI